MASLVERRGEYSILHHQGTLVVRKDGSARDLCRIVTTSRDVSNASLMAEASRVIALDTNGNGYGPAN